MKPRSLSEWQDGARRGRRIIPTTAWEEALFRRGLEARGAYHNFVNAGRASRRKPISEPMKNRLDGDIGRKPGKDSRIDIVHEAPNRGLRPNRAKRSQTKPFQKD